MKGRGASVHESSCNGRGGCWEPPDNRDPSDGRNRLADTSLAVVSVSILDVQWAGGDCMDIPVILVVTSSPYTTSWSTELSSEGYRVYFSGSGRVSSSKQYLKMCKSGGLVPGTYALSGEVSVRSTNPLSSVSVDVSAPFTISKAPTGASIYHIQRANDRVTVSRPGVDSERSTSRRTRERSSEETRTLTALAHHLQPERKLSNPVQCIQARAPQRHQVQARLWRGHACRTRHQPQQSALVGLTGLLIRWMPRPTHTPDDRSHSIEQVGHRLARLSESGCVDVGHARH
jgi:hypothetical protein